MTKKKDVNDSPTVNPPMLGVGIGTAAHFGTKSPYPMGELLD